MALGWDSSATTISPMLDPSDENYHAQATEVDHYMGVILEQLNRLGLAENTIIIYASDHGDFAAHHGMTEKCALGHNVYEDTLRVPLIISWPARFAKDIVCESLVELLDLYPTLFDLQDDPLETVT